MKLYFIYFKRYISSYPIRLTFLTLGVTIAVLFISFMGMLTDSIHATSMEKRYSNYGEFQGMAIGISQQDVESIESNNQIQEAGYSEIVGTMKAGYENISLGVMDIKATQFSRVKLTEGTLPESADEIAIEDVVLKSMKADAKIGDRIDLKLSVSRGQEEESMLKSYIISGIFENKPLRTLLEDSYTTGGSGIEHAVMPVLLVSDKGFNDLAQEYDVQKNVLFTLKDKSHTSEIISQMKFNVPVLTNTLYNPIKALQLKQYDDTITMDNYILIILVVLLAVIGIVQSFYITIQERQRQLGILRAIGAVRSQLRSIVFGEAFMISVVAIPIGVLLSIAVLKLSMLYIEKFSGQPQVMIISSKTIIVSISICAISVISAAFLPARKAMSVSPMEVISGGSVVSSNIIGKSESKSPKKAMTVIILAIRNLKRQRARSIMMTTVIMLTIFTAIFSYNYNKMLKLDWVNTMKNEASYLYRIQSIGSGSKIGKVTLENGMNEEQIVLLKQVLGVRTVDKYKYLNSSLVGIRVQTFTDYYQDMPGIVVQTNTDNNWNAEWVQQQIEKLGDDVQPVNFKVIGVNEKLLSELVPKQQLIYLDSAILYTPLPNSNYQKVDFQDMGLAKNDSISLVYYGNKGNQDFDVTKFKLTNIINSLPNLMADEDIFKNSVCIFIDEKNFNKLTSESLYNELYVYGDESINYKSVSFDEDIRKIVSMGRKLFVESRLSKILEMNNESKILMLRLYATTGVFVVLTLFILSNVIISSVFARKREFGMLRAVGITKMQLNWMVSLENGILCIGAGVAGILLMLFFIIIRGSSIGGTVYEYSIITQFPYLFSIITVISSLVISIIMSIFTLKKILHLGIIDAIRYVE